MRSLSFIPAVLSLLLFCTLLHPAQTNSLRRLDGSRITISEADAFARKTLADARVTGAEIAVIEGGRLRWSAGYGLRRRNPDLPMTADTVTWSGSITKSVFATYFMQLVEHGEVSLDTPIVKQFPLPLDHYDLYREWASELVHDAKWPSVTPRMLLSHTSGLPNLVMFEPDKKLHLYFQPGTKFHYSGEGLNVLQFLLEQKYGKTLDILMQDAIFGPLGMTRTGIIYRKEFEADIADRFDARGEFRAQTRRFPAHAAGSMSASVNDLAKFACALLSGRLMSDKTRREMLRPIFFIDDMHQFPLRANEGKGEEGPRVGLAYGLGWGLLTHTPFGPAFFKEGHGDGAQNYMICFERSESCMIVLTNSDNGELAFRPLLEKILGDTVTPWEWEGYTRAYIEATRVGQQ